jgi:FAD/FMN-containing dehydrogenase
MSGAVFDRLHRLLGPEGVERDPRGLPRAVPESDDALALVCQAAQDEGWRVRLEGQGSWLPADAPADLALSTRGLNRIVRVSPADLVCTVEAGVTLEALRAALAEAGLWLALDPPGRSDRTLGSVVATGTAGPLRQGFGPVRDHVLGSTVVTGDGRVVEAGGKVVKNVAGYDLTKLHVGGFGGFGVITALHLRVRALPAEDRTFQVSGPREAMFDAGRSLLAAGVNLAALELLTPALAAQPEWTLLIRLVGTTDGVAAEAAQLDGASGVRWAPLAEAPAAARWNLVARAPLEAELALRFGALTDTLDDTMDLVIGSLGEGLLATGLGTGQLRWAGEADASTLRALRRRAAEREIPITLERGGWPIRRAVGHFGAYREGVGMLVGRLRDAFDPKGVIAVALEGADE